jgi:hypothetical protein
MTEEVSKMVSAIIAIMVVLMILPIITSTFEGVNVTSTVEPMKFIMPEIKNPVHKGIIDNMITGILIGGLILVATGLVYLLRFMYGVIRKGAYFEDEP